MRRARRFVLVIAQAVVTTVLLAWFFRDPKFRQEIVEVLPRADGRWLAIGFLIAGAECLLGAIRWFIFLRMLDIRHRFARVVQIQFVGLFFNTVMVGAVGGDLVKVGCLIAEGHRKTRAVLSVLLDRMSGLAALIVATTFFGVTQYDWLTTSPVVSALIHFVFIYLGIATVLLALTFVMCRSGHSARIPKWVPFRDATIDLVDSYALFLVRWRNTALAASISLGMLLCYFAIYYCAARAFGELPSSGHWFALMPIVEVISALPVSIGGIGVREQIFSLVLGQQFGISAATAVSISMIGFLLGASWGLVGASILPFFRGVIGTAKRQSKHATV